MSHKMPYRPLRGHRYHSLPDDSLRYIIKDAGEALRCMKGFDDKAAAKYADQVNDACTVLNYRRTSYAWERQIGRFK